MQVLSPIIPRSCLPCGAVKPLQYFCDHNAWNHHIGPHGGMLPLSTRSASKMGWSSSPTMTKVKTVDDIQGCKIYIEPLTTHPCPVGR